MESKKYISDHPGNYMHFKVIFDSAYHYAIKEDNEIRRRTFWEFTDAEVDELQKKVKGIVVGNNIKDDDIIFFSQSSKFPKTFLSNAGLKIKRTISKDKSTRIVCDKSEFVNFKLLDKSNRRDYYVVLDPLCPNMIFFVCAEELQTIGLDVEECKKRFGGEWTLYRTLPCDVGMEFVNNIINYDSKLTTTEDLIRYMNNNLPLASDDQKATILGLIKSDDIENNKLGFNTLKMFSLKNILMDLVLALNSRSAFDPSISNSIDYKYIRQLIPISSYDLFDIRYYYSDSLKGFAKMFNSGLIDNSQKDLMLKTINERKAYGSRGLTLKKGTALSEKDIKELKSYGFQIENYTYGASSSGN